jgi:DivIVA domain-containing protein
VDQVEDFLEEARQAYSTDAALPTPLTAETIRRTAFTLEKGGYSPAHVDAALERLEEAFSLRERDRAFSTAAGEENWYREARATAQIVLDRLDRPTGQKFSRVGAVSRGYAPKDVDAFADRLVHYFQDGEPLSIEEVRTVVFPTVTHGYDEAQVDYLLETVVKVMLSVR